MAERSFVEEVKKLRLSGGEVFRGEGILAVTPEHFAFGEPELLHFLDERSFSHGSASFRVGVGAAFIARSL